MKTFREKCIEFLDNEDIKRDVKQLIQSVYGMIYNECYPYVWLICIYHVILIFAILANFIWMTRLHSSIRTIVIHTDNF